MACFYDFHIHSCLSPCAENEMTPVTIAGVAALNGLRMAALTDHNSCGNLPVFFAACHAYGVLPVAGIEVESAESVHVVCLFPRLEDAMRFWRQRVQPMIPPFKNKPEIFGDQLFVDEEDAVVGTEPILLINSTSLSIEEIADAARAEGGVPFPAHVDRPANGLIEILGGFPPEPGFGCVEFNDAANIPSLRAAHPALTPLITLTNSDAHRIEQINEAVNSLAIGDPEEDDDVLLKRLFAYLRAQHR
ncbi:MAG: PHP domain-containing protein [Clostridia bacterium]|nr:PHP domain-containing protein [Clostridia bacterium]